jgi:uncharacterized RDD family membrane protein YckC
MKCPKCGLFNPPEAVRCDCGWDFASNTIKESFLGPTASSLANLASLDKRLIGQIIDSLIAIAAIVAAAGLSTLSDQISALAMIVGFGFAIFYILFADGFQNGQSYGKRVVKTAVVDANTGRPCSFGQSLVRNLLLSLLGVLDWLFIFGERRQRLGDKAATTIVVNV